MILVKDLISQITNRAVGYIPCFDEWLLAHKGKPLAIRHSVINRVKDCICVAEVYTIICSCNECGDEYTVILEYKINNNPINT